MEEIKDRRPIIPGPSNTGRYSNAGALRGNKHYDQLIKLVFIGDSSVGKTCLLMRLEWEKINLLLTFPLNTLIQTYDKLRSYLLKAIQECSEGFGFA